MVEPLVVQHGETKEVSKRYQFEPIGVDQENYNVFKKTLFFLIGDLI